MSAEQGRDAWSEAWRLAEKLLALNKAKRESALLGLQRERPAIATAVRMLLGGLPDPPSGTTLAGQILGPYRLRSRIGYGGMGEVWEASHVNLDRLAAVKVLTLPFGDEASLRRFEREAHIQASINHPGIARLYEAGAFSVQGLERPWIAMELVPGARALSEYVGTEKLSPRATVELFAKFCEAIGHAHQQGILHRDIKPSNLLVDATGRPMVIDFGIARSELTHNPEAKLHTRTGTFLGTPRYAAPERLDPRIASVGAQADVYSLGLVLHELLDGRARFDTPEVEHDLQSWVRLRMGGRRLQHYRRSPALEWIVAKATSFDVSRRYVSATDLSEDLDRYLDDRVPSASPESFTYRLRLFLRRNRALAGVSVLVLVSLFLGGMSITVGFLREARAERRAQERDAELAQAYTFLNELMGLLEPDKGLNDRRTVAPGVGYLIERAYDASVERHGDLPWRVQAAVGRLSSSLGARKAARRYLEAALRGAEERFGSSALETLRLHVELSHTLMDLRELDEAERHLKIALRDYLRVGHREFQARTKVSMGALKFLRSDFPAAQRMLEDALSWLLSDLPHDDPTITSARTTLAHVYERLGRYNDERVVLTDLVAQREGRTVTESPEMAYWMSQLALAMSRTGDTHAGVELADEAVRLAAKWLDEIPLTSLDARSARGNILVDLGRFPEAIAEFEEILAASQGLFGDESDSVRRARWRLAHVLMRDGQNVRTLEVFGEGEPERMKEIARSGPHSLDAYDSLNSLGVYAQALQGVGSLKEALAAASHAFEGLRDSKSAGPTHPSTLTVQAVRASILQDLGRSSDAESDYRAAMQGMEAAHPAHRSAILSTRTNLASLLADEGDYEAAVEIGRACVADLETMGLLDTIQGILTRQNLGFALWKEGRVEDAHEVLLGILNSWPKEIPENHPGVQPVFLNLARCYAALGNEDEARSLVRKMLTNVQVDSPIAISGRDLLDRL